MRDAQRDPGRPKRDVVPPHLISVLLRSIDFLL
jgi:hypothetical protein